MNEYDRLIVPNTFVIGAQKSATTSIYDWVAQHPQACGPLSLKDSPIFYRDDPKLSLGSIQSEYIAEGYNYETKVILQGWVQYLYYTDALQQIREHSPNAKLVIVLRDPTDRAISAYRFFRKLGREKLSLKDALDREQERKNGTFEERNDLTYVEHGLYASQLKKLLEIFDSRNIFIAIFDDVHERPQKVVNELYTFLGLDLDFKPIFSAKNVTGTQRLPWLDHALSKPNILRSLIVKYLVDPVFPLHKRTALRWKLRSWNTMSQVSPPDEDFSAERQVLRQKFRQEILDLEALLGISLPNWK